MALGNLLSRIAALYEVPVARLIGRSQTQSIVAIRHEAIWLVHRIGNASHAELGHLFRRDRATIYYALQKVQDAYDGNATTRCILERTLKQLCPIQTPLKDHVVLVVQAEPVEIDQPPPGAYGLHGRQWVNVKTM